MSVNAYGMPTGVQIPPATDFRQNQTASSRYRFRRIAAEGNNNCVRASASATQDINFRFGAGYVINLAETRLRIYEQFGLGDGTGNTKSIYTRALPPIAGIRLQTSSGVILLDVQNFESYAAAIYPFVTKKEDVPREARTVGYANATVQTASADAFVGPLQAATAASTPTTPGSFGMPGTIAAGTSLFAMTAVGIPSATVGASTPGGPLLFPSMNRLSQPTSATVTGNFEGLFAPVEMPNAYIDVSVQGAAAFQAVEANMPRQYIPCAFSSGAGAQTILQWDMPLRKLLPHTLCAQLQDLYFGTDLLLTVSLAAYGNRSFMALGQTQASGVPLDHTDGFHPINASVINTGAVIATTTSVTLGAVTTAGATGANGVSWTYAQDLLLCTQDNLDLVNSVKQEIAGKGIRIPVQQPFISLDSMAVPSANTQTVYARTIRLNIARGAALLKWYSGINTTAAVITGAFPFKNLPGNQRQGVWQLYRAYLNAVPMSDSALSCYDAWHRMRHWTKGSLVEGFLAWCQINGYIVEDFTSGFDLTKTTPEGGLPLANPIDVQLEWSYGNAITPAAGSITNVWIGVMLKYLSISPAGVTLESV